MQVSSFYNFSDCKINLIIKYKIIYNKMEQFVKCIDDTYKLNSECIDIGKYRIPKNSNYKDINNYMLIYLNEIYNNPVIADEEMDIFCSLLPSKNCISPCNNINYFWYSDCGYKKMISEKVFHTLYLSTIQPNIALNLVYTIQLLSKYVFVQNVVENIFDILTYTLPNASNKNYESIYEQINYKENPINIFINIEHILFAVIEAPITEEILYRFIPNKIENAINNIIEYVLNYFDVNSSYTKIIKDSISLFVMFTSATIFGIIHAQNYYLHRNKFVAVFQVMNCIIMGIILNCINKKYGFKYSVMYHMVNNLLSTILSGRNFMWNILSLFLLLPYTYIKQIKDYYNTDSGNDEKIKKKHQKEKIKKKKSRRKIKKKLFK